MAESMFIDFYAVLSVSPKATTNEIRRAYMEQIKHVHPDKLINASDFTRKEAEKKSQALNEAKETLLDPTKRAEYDALYRSVIARTASLASEQGFSGQGFNDYLSQSDSIRLERDAMLRSQKRFKPIVITIAVVMSGLSMLWILVKPEKVEQLARTPETISMPEPIRTLPIGNAVIALALSSDKNHLLISTDSAAIEVWNTATLRPERKIQLASPAICIHAAQNRIAVGERNGTCEVFADSGSAPILKWAAHTQGIADVKLSPSGKELVTASWEKNLKVWKFPSGDLITTRMGVVFPIYACAFDGTGQYIAFNNDQQSMLWSWRESTMRSLTLHKRRIYSIVASPDGEWISSAGEDRLVKQVHLKSNTVRVTESASAAIIKHTYSPDGRMIAAACADGRIRIYGSETSRKLETLAGHREKSQSLAFSADSKTLYTSGADSVVRVWDLSKYTRKEMLNVE
jgi:hypothetical protein